MVGYSIQEAPAKKLAPGVEEKTLISPTISGSKVMILKHITIEPWSCMELKDFTEERFYYVLSGRGEFTLPSGARLMIESDYCIFVPCGMKHKLQNTGESPMTCTVWSGKTETTGGEYKVLQMHKASKEELVGYVHRPLLDGIMLKLLGAKKIIYSEYETVSPGIAMALSLHTGAEEAYYIIRGEGKVAVGDKELPVKAGSSVFIPSNTKHYAKNTGKYLFQFVSILASI